jgi:hypothetical protein
VFEDTAQLQIFEGKQEGHKKFLFLTVIRIRTRILKLFGLPDTDSLSFYGFDPSIFDTVEQFIFMGVDLEP